MSADTFYLRDCNVTIQQLLLTAASAAWHQANIKRITLAQGVELITWALALLYSLHVTSKVNVNVFLYTFYTVHRKSPYTARALRPITRHFRVR